MGRRTFYIRTGKRMKSKTIQVVVEFKEVPMNLYYETDKKLDSNLLVINIQPNEGVSLHLNAKKNVQGRGQNLFNYHMQ